MIEFGFISKLLESFLGPLLTRSAGELERRIFKGTQAAQDGGTLQQRFTAYEDLRRACVELRTVLDVLWSLQPLRFVGALVSLPIQFRLLHRITPLAAAVNDAFLAVAVVGRRDVVASAQGLAKGLQSVLESRKSAGAGRRTAARHTDWSDFDEALGCQGTLVSARRRS